MQNALKKGHFNLIGQIKSAKQKVVYWRKVVFDGNINILKFGGINEQRLKHKIFCLIFGLYVV